ncbi:MAG: hypothetical protein ACAI38_04505 [Myxococcota bacterium]
MMAIELLRIAQGNSVRTLGVLALVLLASSSGVAATPSDDPHDKLFVLDVKIGMPIEGRPGFTCDKEKRTASGERQDRHCVKFVDERCKGRPGNVGFKKYGEKAPKGCYLDHSSQATFLDDLLLQDAHSGDTSQAHNGRRPLANVHLVGTESTPSKIYRIHYMFAEDDLLAESSKLHQALVAKYGEPREIHSGKMKWKIDSTELVAQCIPNNNCEIVVQDRKFEENEEAAQKEADAQKKSAEAPAPKL